MNLKGHNQTRTTATTAMTMQQQQSKSSRWRGVLWVGVLGLVVLSTLVPLLFLVNLNISSALHSNSNSYSSPIGAGGGFVSDLVPSSSSNNHRTVHTSTTTSTSLHQNNQSGSHLDGLLKRFAPSIPKDALGTSSMEAESVIRTGTVGNSAKNKDNSVASIAVTQPLHRTDNTGVNGKVEGPPSLKSGVDESGKSCQLKYGSYCRWRREQREEMNDYMIKKLKDQLFIARAYYPSIAKAQGQDKLSRNMKQNIQEVEHILSIASTDADLPKQIGKSLEKLEAVIERAKLVVLDCNNVDKKLRQILDLTEDEADFHMKQSAFLYQLAVQTMPKSLHCLSLRLTVEYFRSSQDLERLSEKSVDPSLHHYVIFSTNVLAASVVINSTVMHAKETRNQVFHVLTNGENYFAMKFWLLRNTYKEATVQVLNVEELDMDHHDEAFSYPFMPQEYLVFSPSIGDASTINFRSHYVSTFSHFHYLLPKIFQNLHKIVVMEDDIVVQQDSSALWNINMKEKVIGAVQSCALRMSQLKSFLRENMLDSDSCVWMSGLNIIDLVRWRELDLTKSYQKFVEEETLVKGSTKNGSLRATLLTLQNLTYALDETWNFRGLGHDYQLDIQAIQKAKVLHYNGNMKPWLDLGIPRFKDYWKKFLNPDDQLLSECNINVR